MAARKCETVESLIRPGVFCVTTALATNSRYWGSMPLPPENVVLVK
jgi:hypothetical protein